MVAVDGAEFVMADIPGLIEGAHEGRGIGDRFLGHVERSAVLLHLVDGTAEDPAADWRTVIAELEAYGGALAEKPRLTALNKIDALDEDERAAARAALEAVAGPVHFLSGATSEGATAVLRALRACITEDRLRQRRVAEEPAPWRP